MDLETFEGIDTMVTKHARCVFSEMLKKAWLE